jgi:hypothetical protein
MVQSRKNQICVFEIYKTFDLLEALNAFGAAFIVITTRKRFQL